jgi:hypothetical protein
LYRQCRRSGFCGASVNTLLAVQEGNPIAAKRESRLQTANVWDVLAELSGKDREVRHARGADILVSQVPRF